jgi:hypothetical protein
VKGEWASGDRCAAHSPHFVAPHGSARNPKSPGKSEDCGALSDSALLLSGGHGTRTDSRNGLSDNDLGKSEKHFGTFSGTVGDETGKFDPDLLAVVEAWPGLPCAARQRIREIVDSHVSNPEGTTDVDANG